SNPMPEKQVATYLTSVTPSSAYDTPPKFLKGYAPFFPETEAKRRHWGYALVEFSVTADGATSDIRPITATAYSFAEEAMWAMQSATRSECLRLSGQSAIRQRTLLRNNWAWRHKPKISM